ncbi:hypothetical protein EYF80_035672 [Liparis tanakae]|uniref:Uncharacterized protein n=1 Tax=Liparis tanakae TaxID=230148 RepID=A0A4Z2GMU0_9TELE|nr:hypothetical protein EYF80_035672 [Liparis tanakae]
MQQKGPIETLTRRARAAFTPRECADGKTSSRERDMQTGCGDTVSVGGGGGGGGGRGRDRWRLMMSGSPLFEGVALVKAVQANEDRLPKRNEGDEKEVKLTEPTGSVESISRRSRHILGGNC